MDARCRNAHVDMTRGLSGALTISAEVDYQDASRYFGMTFATAALNFVHHVWGELLHPRTFSDHDLIIFTHCF